VTKHRAGFTLIEILVVVLVVSIIMGVVVGSFTGVDKEQELRGFAERLALRIELARDRALQRNQEWGLYIDEDGIRFAEFDEVNVEWLDRVERPFNNESYTSSLEIRVKATEFETQLLGEAKELPEIVLFSSGETTPFEIEIEPTDWETRPWLLSSDGFSRTGLDRLDI
jgi:general secretion pathway protein H